MKYQEHILNSLYRRVQKSSYIEAVAFFILVCVEESKMKDITFAPSSTDDLEAARSSPLSLNISSHHRILARHDTHVTNATGTNAAKMPLRPPLVEESDESNFSRFTDGLNEMVENEQDESRSTVPKIAFGLSRTIKIVRVTALSVLTTTALLVSTMTYFLASQKYRSDEIESQISSSDPALNASNPALFTSIVAALFTLTIILFLGYHRMVERRHRVVLSQALKSTAIVASLFPERVHHRLLETATKQTKTRKTSAKTNSFNDEDLEENDCSLSSEYSERLEKVKVKDPSKMKLKEILRDKTQTDGSLLEELQPIADFFPNCTVMVR